MGDWTSEYFKVDADAKNIINELFTYSDNDKLCKDGKPGYKDN